MKKPELDEERFRAWMMSLIRKLLTGYGLYFSKDGTLNSDGRKLLEDILKPTVKRYPHLKQLARKVRRDPTLENVIKLASIYLNDDEIHALLQEGIIRAGMS